MSDAHGIVDDADLEAYLDEALPVEEMVRIEAALRSDSEVVARLVRINRRRDTGLHSLGEIWRRYRITCPTREQLGSYLLGVLDAELRSYIDFHLQEIGCRVCQANFEDLRAKPVKQADDVVVRRRKYFQSSAGYLSQREDER